MKTSRKSKQAWAVRIGWVLLCVLGAVPGIALADGGLVDEGQSLFEREFVAGEAGRSGGDGLGPVFNHVSCAACHRLGALGGAGPIDVNVTLMTAELTGRRPERRKLLDTLKSVHPALVEPDGTIAPSVILHRFGADERYAKFRSRFISTEIPLEPTPDQLRELQQKLARAAQQTAKSPAPLRLALSQRNTTALFGAGLIDQIPEGVLRTLAEQQAKHSEVSGRVPPIGIEGVGRFGWRGQIERLHDFVLGACANELGLEVPGTPQPRNPLRPDYRPVGLDLTAAQCASLTAYVAALPEPRFVMPDDPEQQQLVERGRETFVSVGCATCHVERVGPIEGVYSDFLLHDMGPALADPVPAEPALTVTGRRLPPVSKPFEDDASGVKQQRAKQVAISVPPQPSPSRGYNGGSSIQSLVHAPQNLLLVDPKTRERVEFRVVESAVTQEWRTPPLWGLADSAPYLHDGRAATVLEAIALHGGEAEASVQRFFALPVADRLALLQFLSCLRAP